MRVTLGLKSGLNLGVAAAVLALAGCAKPVPLVLEAPLPEAPLNIAAPILPQPQPPAGMAATFRPPPRLPNGSYMTINSNIGPDETLWHLRSALNVAALSCAGTTQAAIVADYNGILNDKKAALLDAYTKVRANLKKSFGTGWETQFDQDNTRIYNFFSQIQPDAHQEFCLAAAPVAKEMRTVAGPALNTYAAATLPRLEKPFLEMYASFDRYRVELAEWTTRYGAEPTQGAAMMASVTTTQPQTVALPASVPARTVSDGPSLAAAPAPFAAQPATQTASPAATSTPLVGPPAPASRPAPAAPPAPPSAARPTLPYAPVSDPTLTH